jgi:hypothetical protein
LRSATLLAAFISCYLVLLFPIVLLHELAKGFGASPVENGAEMRIRPNARQEVGAIDLAECADMGIAALVVNLAILIAVATVETGLLRGHKLLLALALTVPTPVRGICRETTRDPTWAGGPAAS